ncbi:hypothetical protein [Oligoflexus tunisiensis]|uniref:hypothetical protein n=1 Tax=Oligoflexus tunisiensis TaxID=708132 RepID=UPI00114CF3BE|nr:hypothetical protein [Oligoflexus tunisiensis]
MNLLHTIVLSLVFSSTLIAGVKENQESNIDLGSKISSDREYTFSASSVVKPLGVYSSIGARTPIKLTVACDGSTILADEFFYTKHLKGVDKILQVSISNFSIKCPSLAPQIILEPNGIELEISSPFYTYKITDVGANFESIKRDRDSKAKQLASIMATLSNEAGAKESFYCMIKTQDANALVPDGTIQAMKTEYAKDHGDFDLETNIICPVPEKGALTKMVDVCQKEGDENLSDFCLKYDRYLKIRDWYYSSIDRLIEIAAELNPTLAQLGSEIKRVQDGMDTEIQGYERTLRGKINEDQPEPSL